MLRQIIAASTIAVSLLCFVPQSHAESNRQCEARAYANYERNIRSGMSHDRAAHVLDFDLGSCPQR